MNTQTKEMLLVGSKAKAALKGHGVNVGGAGANGRKTVRAHDFNCN